MSDATGIDWTDATWNLFRGCLPVSPGCTNCYATREAVRQGGPGGAYEGLVRRADPATGAPPKWTGLVRFVPELLGLPLGWEAPRRIFVDSMSDVFHDGFAFEKIAAHLGVVAAAWWHTFQIVTKRPDRAVAFFQWLEAQGGDPAAVCWMHARRFAPSLPANRTPAPSGGTFSNLWILASVEDQQRARERLPELVQLRRWVTVLGVSAEPLLERVDLVLWLADLDWVIVGGESGPRARLCELDWIRDLVAQCEAAEVAVFVKQLGRVVPGLVQVGRTNQKRHDPAGFPVDLRGPGRRAFPVPRTGARRVRRAA